MLKTILIIGFVIFFIEATSLARNAESIESNEPVIPSTRNTLATSPTPPLTAQFLNFEGIEALYQLPSEVTPLGVLFVAHGCSHSATDWWPPQDSCPQCLGLPVELSITRYALRNSYAIIAISSQNRRHRCWSPKDLTIVGDAINYFYRTVLGNNIKIPLYFLGASSGGNFVGMLAQHNGLKPSPAAICVQISSIAGGERMASIPPTLFVLMSRDLGTLPRVKQVSKILTKSSILITEPRSISPSYLFEKSNGFVSYADSATIQKALISAGYLDSITFKLADDPRTTNWRNIVTLAVPHFVSANDSLQADASTISELLNLAWDMHEITDDFNEQIFAWFEANRHS